MGGGYLYWYISTQDVRTLSRNIYWEGTTAGESEDGLRMIGLVTLNRKKANRSYWGGNTIKGVVYARKSVRLRNGKIRTVCQFSWTCLTDREPRNERLWNLSWEVADEILAGNFTPPKAFLNTTSYLNPKTARRRNLCEFDRTLVRIGSASPDDQHIFYREPDTTAEKVALKKVLPDSCKPPRRSPPPTPRKRPSAGQAAQNP
jgi:hypothetical protein